MGFTYSFGDPQVYLIKTDSDGNSGCYETTPTPFVSSGGAEGLTGGTQAVGGMTTTPAALTGSGGKDSIVCSLATSMHEIKVENLISFWPNPSNGFFTIASSEKISQMEILNVLGEKVYSSSNLPDRQAGNLHLITFKIDLGKQPKGVYFYKALLEKGEIATGKLVIE